MIAWRGCHTSQTPSNDKPPAAMATGISQGWATDKTANTSVAKTQSAKTIYRCMRDPDLMHRRQAGPRGLKLLIPSV